MIGFLKTFKNTFFSDKVLNDFIFISGQPPGEPMPFFSAKKRQSFE